LKRSGGKTHVDRLSKNIAECGKIGETRLNRSGKKKQKHNCKNREKAFEMFTAFCFQKYKVVQQFPSNIKKSSKGISVHPMLVVPTRVIFFP